MNKKIFALTLLSIIDLLLVITNSAFSSDIKWTKIYRGPYQEHAINVQQTPDSGYIVIGLIRRNNKYSIWLIKTDAFGDTLWTNKYGKNNFFWKPLIKPTADDGYIIAGSIPSEEKRLVLAIRTDASGNILWERSYEQEKIIGINQIQQTLDYGFILVGFTYTNDYYTQSGWLIKTDKQGNVQWTQTLSSERGIEPKSILQLEDGGFLIGADWGWSIISLIKINSSGDSLWTKNYSKDIINRVLFLKNTVDGNFYLLSDTGPPSTDRIWLIKFDVNGDTLWTKILISTEGIYDDYPISFQQTMDGGHIILADVSSRYALQGNWIIKMDAIGDTVWTKYISATPSGVDPLRKVETLSQTSDGGYVLSGWEWDFPNYNFYARLTKIDSSGASLWEKQYAVNQYNNIQTCQQTTDCGFILAGITSKDDLNTNTDILLIKTDASGNTEPPITKISEDSKIFSSKNYKLHQNHPNPFNSSTEIKYSLPQDKSSYHVTLKIYDIRGRLVNTLVDQNQADGTYTVSWDGKDINGNDVSSGIYFYVLQTDKFNITKKMLLIH